jgi:hypothetical protein
MPLDFMFNYIDIKGRGKKKEFTDFTDAEKEETAHFINKQLGIMDKQSPIPLTDFFTLPHHKVLVNWEQMVSNSSYWTERGRVTWEDVEVGDVIAWTCFSCGWSEQVWFIKLLDKEFRDERLVCKFGYAFLSNLGYSLKGQENVSVRATANKNWQRPSSGNLYGSVKGVWRKISEEGGFINWVNATPFSEKP